jgi:heat shock protein HspQ
MKEIIMIKEEFTIGDKVTYDHLSLCWSYRGIVIDLDKGTNGGDCHVRWTRPNEVVAEECIRNLRKLNKEESL